MPQCSTVFIKAVESEFCFCAFRTNNGRKINILPKDQF